MESSLHDAAVICGHSVETPRCVASRRHSASIEVSRRSSSADAQVFLMPNRNGSLGTAEANFFPPRVPPLRSATHACSGIDFATVTARTSRIVVTNGSSLTFG